MYSVFKGIAITALVVVSSLAFARTQKLWVCADRDNLPYSNNRKQGFENKLAQMIAHDLGRTLQYVWWPASPTFARKIFRSGACEIIMGVPSKNYDLAEPTIPYYSSSYMFVSRRDRHLHIRSFDDPTLRTTRIGLHVIDNGFTPAAQELARRGIIGNVIGYNPFGNLNKDNQPAELIHAVARGDIDVAIVWGPLAGYFAEKSNVPLDLNPVCQASGWGALPQAFAISIGVRPGEETLRTNLNAELKRRRNEIHRLLVSYNIPLITENSILRFCQ